MPQLHPGLKGQPPTLLKIFVKRMALRGLFYCQIVCRKVYFIRVNSKHQENHDHQNTTLPRGASLHSSMSAEEARKTMIRFSIAAHLRSAPKSLGAASVQQVRSFRDWHKKTTKRLELRSLSLAELESLYVTVNSTYQ